MEHIVKFKYNIENGDLTAIVDIGNTSYESTKHNVHIKNVENEKKSLYHKIENFLEKKDEI